MGSECICLSTKNQRSYEVSDVGIFASRDVSFSLSHTRNSKLNKAGYDCVFLEGPHILPITSTIEIEGVPVEIENGKRENARAWFLLSETDPADASQSQSGQPLTYIGLEKALNIVKYELEQDEEGFVAVMGFSQGGVFAHILSRLADSAQAPFDRIRAALIASAFAAQHIDEHSSPYSYSIGNMPDRTPISLPSLHIIGKKDTSVLPKLSEDLSALFNNRQYLYHEKGHILPQTSAECQAIISFLDRVADII